MTKQEAIEEMKKGAKLKHRLFTSNEWITMQGNLTIITEEGYRCPIGQFWFYRQGQEWDLDWYIFEE